jgi:RNA polymerase primary sigma factor
VIKKQGYDRMIAQSPGLSADDLQQAGMIALIKAAERFDPARGFKFSTYAVFWIRHFVGRLIEDHSVSVRVPIFLQHRRRKAGELPRCSVKSLDRATGHRHGTIGLDEGTTYLDLLASPGPENDRDALPDMTLEELIAATPALTANDRAVLRGRAQDLTLKEIGHQLGICRERVRQIELCALVKVRRAQGLEIDDDLEQRFARLRKTTGVTAAPDHAPA